VQNIIFIFSLPRSGSTLLQRVLSSHPLIHTVSEPWILLPLIYQFKENTFAEYSYKQFRIAFNDFLSNFKEGESFYFGQINKLVTNLYNELSPEGTKYFIDKTPRYSIITKEIVRIFPEAKFIFLWRNPISVISSIIDYWGKGSIVTKNWNWTALKIDLYSGLENLIEGRDYCDGNCLNISYENLVMYPSKSLNSLKYYLNMEDDINFTLNSQTLLDGKLGDKSVNQKSRHIEQLSINRWKYIISNPLRKKWCINYIRWIGKSRLESIGYSYDYIIEELISNPTTQRYVGKDILGYFLGKFIETFELPIFQKKIINHVKRRNTYLYQ
jgi:hypothetical protein